MSRLTSLSAEALRQLYSPDSDSTLITLLTIFEPDNTTVKVRLCDNFIQRLDEDEEDVVYGVTSRGQEYIFLPMQITLPSEEEANAPRYSIVMQDVTRQLTPLVRSVNRPLKIRLELVLSKSPDTVEVEFDDFFVSNFTFNREQVSAELSMLSLEREPFPCFSFNPAYNPGLF